MLAPACLTPKRSLTPVVPMMVCAALESLPLPRQAVMHRAMTEPTTVMQNFDMDDISNEGVFEALIPVRLSWIPQLDAPEWAVIGCDEKARRRGGLLPARRSHAASAPQGGSIGCVALTHKG